MLRCSRATVIYTTHRKEEAAYADRVIRMFQRLSLFGWRKKSPAAYVEQGMDSNLAGCTVDSIHFR